MLYSRAMIQGGASNQPLLSSIPITSLTSLESARYLGRDVTWLSFNERVLHMATDASVPLLERVRFLTIFSSNLDEFFMKRFALLRRRMRAGLEPLASDGMTLRQQFARLRKRVLAEQTRLAEILGEDVKPELARAGIRLVEFNELTPEETEALDEWFRNNVFPVLTPLSVDPGHRFPFVSNLSTNLGVLLSHPVTGEHHFARLKIPSHLDRLIRVPNGEIDDEDTAQLRFVPLDQIILHNLHEVFPGLDIADVLAFRVTRAAGMEIDDEEFVNLLEHVEAELKQRRFADPVRIETSPDPSPEILALLLAELGLEEEDVFARPGPLEYGDLMHLLDIDRPDLKQAKWIPVIPSRLGPDSPDVFSVIRERDIFLHHPYDSFRASVERFVAEAADDPEVLAIKQTIYRTSRDSPFIDSLIRAAEAGKSVACLVELRARFDEDRNVSFARQLEDHGVHVAYGVVGLKTHCKCSLVVRREDHGLRRYAHIGTGNYHPGTAQLYTDCGLLTCDEDLTADVLDLFNYLTGRSLKTEYRRLLVAPATMRDRFIDRIEAEAEAARQGRPARVIAKMNSLQDVEIIERLYAASQAGVKVTLIVRGFCCLRPGVPDLSENIRVVSIIGRFLEHSRIFHFANGSDDPIEGSWFIGSADWMRRNLSDRVEAVTPIEDVEARRQLWHIISVQLSDRRRAWMLEANGAYTLLQPASDDSPDSPSQLGTFEALCREALQR